jgi:hypothetical protein
MSADKLVVFSMRPDPKPLHSAVNLVRERAVALSNAHGPDDGTDALEMNRWMARISFE